jgi:Tfp pilus assembly protein PilF
MENTRTVTEQFKQCLLPAIILLTVVVFSPVMRHDFINLDDNVFVYENPSVTAGLTIEGIRWAFTTGHEVNWIPLSWLSHMLDVELFGLRPGGHHLVNLLLHAANSGLLFVFLRRVTNAPWRSAVVAALFALHPLHVESVAWVAERKDVLSAFFAMLTLIAYARYSEKPCPGRYVTTLLFFMLGLLSKPMLVTLPVVLVLLDYWPLGRIPVYGDGSMAAHCPGFSRLITEKVPFLLLSISSSSITYLVQQSGGMLQQENALLSRAGNACIAYVIYLYKMIWPADLAVLYPFPKYQPSSARMLTCFFLILFISTAVVWLRKRSPYLAVGWFWYLITLLPVIGLIQIGQHYIADRYTYIPLIGIFIMIVWGIPPCLAGWQKRDAILGVAAALLLAVMIAVTSRQLRHWQNGFTILTHAIAVTSGNWVAHNNLGLLYLQKEDTGEAIHQFKQAIGAKPNYIYAHLNLGGAYLICGSYDKAIEEFTEAIQLDPYNAKAHYGRGISYLQAGKRDLALEQYQILRAMGTPFAAGLGQMINSTPAEKAEALF